jgi:hypothetical protein
MEGGVRGIRTGVCVAVALLLVSGAFAPGALDAQSGSGRTVQKSRRPAGGVRELASGTDARPPFSTRDVAKVVPASRGRFVFPAPYRTEAYRITIPDDCGGADCVNSVGYAYWRNINNHSKSDRLLIVLTLDTGSGGGGPTLFELDKVSGDVRKRGPLFGSNDRRRHATGEGWYFSATAETLLYVPEESRLTRVDVLTGHTRVVFSADDGRDVFGSGRHIWQVHSSHDDRVHSFTVRDERALGCGVFLETTGEFRFFPTLGLGYDECQIDRSGDWLLIKEQIDGRDGEDNRIINLRTVDERRLFDRDGAGGHSDMGFGSMVAADNWLPTGMAWRLWQFDSDPLGPGTIVYSDPSWQVSSINHVSWQHATDGPAAVQFACGSGAGHTRGPRVGEIVCFRLDGSLSSIVVAPVMTDLDAPGGDSEYWRLPKGNIDVTGEYFIWTSNLGGDRLDAFVVRIPVEWLFFKSGH